jgi:hypothetical protein
MEKITIVLKIKDKKKMLEEARIWAFNGGYIYGEDEQASLLADYILRDVDVYAHVETPVLEGI